MDLYVKRIVYRKLLLQRQGMDCGFLNEVAGALSQILTGLKCAYREPKTREDLETLLSPKMLCLLDNLKREHKFFQSDISCLVFVQQRAITKIIGEALRQENRSQRGCSKINHYRYESFIFQVSLSKSCQRDTQVNTASLSRTP